MIADISGLILGRLTSYYDEVVCLSHHVLLLNTLESLGKSLGEIGSEFSNQWNTTALLPQRPRPHYQLPRRVPSRATFIGDHIPSHA